MSVLVMNNEHNASEDHFSDLNILIQQAFDKTLENGPVFRTDVVSLIPNIRHTLKFTNDLEVTLDHQKDLFDIYLDALPAANNVQRQHYNCSTCRQFMKKYGDLVTVDDSGNLVPVMWTVENTGFYQAGIDAVRDLVSKAKITAVFFSKETEWGTRTTGEWTHFAVVPPKSVRHTRVDKTAGEMIAHSKERFRMVMDGLTDIKIQTLDEALRVMKADAVNRSEKFIGPLQWLRDLHDRPRGRLDNNLFWKAVALAPEGFCHPRSGVLATLFEDIEKGMEFDAVRRRFNAKTHGLAYQRPQADPKAGALLQAEKLVEQLGIAKSLERRFARLDEVRTIWKSKDAQKPADKGGIFDHLKVSSPDTVAAMDIPPKTMTWEKFLEKVLPTTEQLQLLVPHIGSFRGVLSAEHADAPPILKWDQEDNRYPISSYVYHKGSNAYQWGLTGLTWAKIPAIMPTPCIAEENVGHVILIIEGSQDRMTGQGNALFPEIIRGELHGVRSVIEAYSRAAEIGGRDQASANGLEIKKGLINIRLQAFDGKHWNQYTIDRFE